MCILFHIVIRSRCLDLEHVGLGLETAGLGFANNGLGLATAVLDYKTDFYSHGIKPTLLDIDVVL